MRLGQYRRVDSMHAPDEFSGSDSHTYVAIAYDIHAAMGVQMPVLRGRSYAFHLVDAPATGRELEVNV